MSHSYTSASTSYSVTTTTSVTQQTHGGTSVHQRSKPGTNGFRKDNPSTQRVEKAGHKGLHFHDLRHTGNVLAAKSGETSKDLMARMGHRSMAAALIYQHASSEADRRIADHIGAAMRTALSPKPVVSKAETDSRGEAPESAAWRHLMAR